MKVKGLNNYWLDLFLKLRYDLLCYIMFKLLISKEKI